MSMKPDMEYHTVQGNKYTFEDKPVQDFVVSHLSGRVLNTCSGKTQLQYDGEIKRNDIDTDMPADTHLDVHELPDEYGKDSFDTIVFDPPWSGFQSNDKYDGGDVNWTKEIKEGFDRMIRPNGSVIQIGYSTVCMPGRLEYERVAVSVFQPYGRRKAFYATVDTKNPQLREWL